MLQVIRPADQNAGDAGRAGQAVAASGTVTEAAARPMRISDLFRTSSFRLAVLFAFAVTAATTVVFLFIYLHVATFDIRRVDARLSEEVARAAAEPGEQLRRQLRRRLASDLRKLDYVGLFDPAGKPLFGNVAALPETLPIDGRAHQAEVAPLGAGSGTEPSMLAAHRRANGDVVLIGRSLYEVYALRRLVVRALALGIAPTILFALVIGVVFSLRTVRRLRSVNAAILRIMQGDLQDRLPVGRWKDDVDNLANGVNLMLDEIVRLLGQIRSVSDNIAHDLRAPLTITRLSLERGLAAPAEKGLRAAAERALSELDRALTTVTALLRISEIELGRRRPEFTPTDLAEICAAVHELYAPLAEVKSISFTLDAPHPVPLSGDRDLLFEAVANLVDNALKFAPENGAVSISTAPVSGQAEITVCDNGPGVDPGEQNEIFKRFYRSKSTHTIPGTGLGLNLAATIFRLHGLDVEVTDNGPGARFVALQRAPISSETP